MQLFTIICTHGAWAIVCNACLGGSTSEWINVAVLVPLSAVCVSGRTSIHNAHIALFQTHKLSLLSVLHVWEIFNADHVTSSQ